MANNYWWEEIGKGDSGVILKIFLINKWRKLKETVGDEEKDCTTNTADTDLKIKPFGIALGTSTQWKISVSAQNDIWYKTCTSNTKSHMSKFHLNIYTLYILCLFFCLHVYLYDIYAYWDQSIVCDASRNFTSKTFCIHFTPNVGLLSVYADSKAFFTLK